MLSTGTIMDQSPVLERHPQLYFSDGDIVLAAKVSSKSTSTPTAGSPSKYQVYRVHMPVLRHNSPVFANLFADAAPGELYDDVPLVEMIGDTAEDFATLLTFIYNPSEINIHRWDPNTPIAVSPTIRIANKYLVDGLQKYLVQKVREDWPLTLSEWDRREAEIEAMRYAEYASGPRSSSTKPLAQAVPEPASAIRFAFEFGCPEILPAAFYQLARTDPTHDWANPVSYSSDWRMPARWSHLETPDLLRHLRGGKSLLWYVASVPSDETFTAILCRSCLPWWEDAGIPDDVRLEVEVERNPGDYPCYTLLRRIFTAVFREASPGVQDPLKALKECVEYEKIQEVSASSMKSLCTGCDWEFRKWVPRARQELWQKLPEYFEVPSPSPQ